MKRPPFYQLLISTLVILFYSSFSIEGQIDYSKFIYPDVERRSLDLSLFLNGNGFHTNDRNYSTLNRTNFNSNGGLVYSFIKNNRSLQKNKYT